MGAVNGQHLGTAEKNYPLEQTPNQSRKLLPAVLGSESCTAAANALVAAPKTMLLASTETSAFGCVVFQAKSSYNFTSVSVF